MPNLILPQNIKYKLITDLQYNFNIKFKSNTILTNVTYNIDFLNGINISNDITINNPFLYNNKLEFTSKYNITENDNIVIKQNKKYNILEFTELGILFNVVFFNVDINKINNIYYKNIKLYIDKKDIYTNSLIINIPIQYILSNDFYNIYINSINENKELEFFNFLNNIYSNILPLNNNITFEIKNDFIIQNIFFIDNKQYIIFSTDIIFILNKTFINYNNNLFLLFFDLLNNNYYIINNVKLLNYTIQIINIINPIYINNLYTSIFNIKLDNVFNDDKYIQYIYYNTVIPYEFIIFDPQSNEKVIPFNIKSTGDDKIIFYFSFIDYVKINYIINVKKFILNQTLNNQQSELLINLDTTKFIKTWEYLIHTKRLGESLLNKINSIISLNIYKYIFNITLPQTNNTIIYLYNTINDNIIETTQNYEVKNLMTYIYFTQNYNISNYNIIYKNLWTINIFSYNNNILSFVLPDDFIYNNNTKYYYTINDIILTNFKFDNNLIIVTFYNTISNSFIFSQIYKEIDNILYKPKLNKKVKIIFDYPFQYNFNNKFYIIPYTGINYEFDIYLYKLLINDNEVEALFIFNNIGYSYTMPIYLKTINKILVGKIFDRIIENNNKYLIISLNEILNLNLNYTYNFNNSNSYNIILIEYYQKSLQNAEFYTQKLLNEIEVFMEDEINNYNFILDPKIFTDSFYKLNNYYLVSNEGYEINNLFYNNNFILAETMKKTNVNYNIIETKIEEPIFNDTLSFFNYIKFFIGEQLIEEINKDIFNIHNNLYFNFEKRIQFNNLIKIKKTNKNWIFYLPLIFWFNNHSTLALPLLSLNNIELKIKYKINNINNILSNILTNDYVFSKEPYLKLYLISDTILLDTEERRLFGTYSHEYVIERYINYSYDYINNIDTIISKKFNGLIKDIYFITEIINTNINCYQNYVEDYDNKYIRYLNTLNYYNNIINDINKNKYIEDLNIIKNIDYELNIFNKNNYNLRITRICNNLKLNLNNKNDYELLKYIMYIEDKFLQNMNDNKKNNFIIYYIKYIYKNNKIINDISPIEYLNIKINGHDLLSKKNWLYYNSVIPYQKFNSSLPIGYYTFSFSLYPNDLQYSGHLNFSYFDDTTFIIQSNENVINNPYIIKIIVKEYNILRIISGMSSLAWIS